MNKLISLIVLLFFSQLTFSQKNELTVEVDTLTSEWSNIIDDQDYSVDVRLYNSIDSLNGIYTTYFYYKFKNKTNAQLLLNWNYKLLYLFPIDLELRFFSLLLEAKQELISDTQEASSEETQMYYFVRHLNKSDNELSAVKLSQIKKYRLD